jgi:hypothetical protein
VKQCRRAIIFRLSGTVPFELKICPPFIGLQALIPLKPEVQDRKTRFEVLNEFVRSRNGWITLVPGDVEVTIECLPRSSLPDELRAQGYDLTPPATASASWQPRSPSGFANALMASWSR